MREQKGVNDIANIVGLAAIQMDCKLGCIADNLTKAEELIETAAKEGANLIVLPELFNTGYRVEEYDQEFAEPVGGVTTKWIEEKAKKYAVSIVAAIIERGEDGVLYDTALVITPDGCIGKQRKMHLWGDEPQRFGRGDAISVFDMGFAKIGVLICYEIGFPEMARIQALKGADIIVYTSAFGSKRAYAWKLASQSRALENAVYVVASNRTGTEKGETIFGGLSRIVAPNGSVIKEAVENDEVIVAKVDLEQVEMQREAIPYLRDLNEKLVIRQF